MSCGEKIWKAGREKGNTFKESGKQKKGQGAIEVERVEYMRKEQKQRQKGRVWGVNIGALWRGEKNYPFPQGQGGIYDALNRYMSPDGKTE
jgi:hypothetical protein